MTARLAWAVPREPRINGLAVTIKSLDGKPVDDRVWVCEGPNRWNLLRSGAWRFGSLLSLADELGAEVVAVEFRCPVGCGTVETTAERMAVGFCGTCDVATGELMTKAWGNAKEAKGP